MKQLIKALGYFASPGSIPSYLWSGILAVLFGNIPNGLEYFDGYFSQSTDDPNPEISLFWYSFLIIVCTGILIYITFGTYKRALLSKNERWHPVITTIMAIIFFTIVLLIALLIFKSDILSKAWIDGSVIKLFALPALVGTVPIIMNISDNITKISKKKAKPLVSAYQKVISVFKSLQNLTQETVNRDTIDATLDALKGLKSYLGVQENREKINSIVDTDTGELIGKIYEYLLNLDLLFNADQLSQSDVFKWITGDEQTDPGTLLTEATIIKDEFKANRGALYRLIETLRKEWPCLKEEEEQ